MPWENDTPNTKGSCEGHVDPATYGLAIERCPLSCHNTGCDEKRYAGVVYAGKAFEEGLVGNRIHGVVHGAADETFAGCEKECAGDEYVGVGR